MRHSGRPERERGRHRLLISLVAFGLLFALNAFRMSRSGMQWWMLPLVALGVSLPILLLTARTGGRLKQCESLQELSGAIDESGGFRRLTLAWYEYAIARNVVRGSYHGERPADFKFDVIELNRRMGYGVRRTAVLTVGILAWVFVVSIGLCELAFASDGGLSPRVLLFIGALFAVIVAVVGLLAGVMSLTRLSRLGRRLEVASRMPYELRWEALLEIARDEFRLASAA